jgi:hypothetical protein
VTSSGKKYPEGRGHITVAPAEGGNKIDGRWEVSEDGKEKARG